MEIRKRLIQDYLNEPLKVGDEIQVMGLGLQDKNKWGNIREVVEIKNGIPFIDDREPRAVLEQYKKYTGSIGANPFPKLKDRVSNVNFTLDSIIHSFTKEEKYTIKGVQIKSVNFNPFVFIGGKKRFYQRDLVWTLEDKQLLIESIYNNVDCGKILVRQRGWKELEILEEGGHELAWLDIVDGKQRMNCILDFIQDKFLDSYGNLYSDLSKQAQNKLTNHQLISYSELPENIEDIYVLRQFIKVNFAGKPQSPEHIEYVKSLL